jgi:DNA-binding transcriptional regulator YiaG
MGKLETSIKSEIERLSKREMRKVSVPLKRDVLSLKNMLSQIRKAILPLERFVANQQKELAKREIRLEVNPEEVKKSRLSPRLIQSLRKKLNISQKELATLVGVTVGTVHQWETGKFLPKPEKKGALAALRKLSRSDVKKLLAKKSAQ